MTADDVREAAIEAAKVALAHWISPQFGDLHALSPDRALGIAFEVMAPIVAADAEERAWHRGWFDAADSIASAIEDLDGDDNWGTMISQDRAVEIAREHAPASRRPEASREAHPSTETTEGQKAGSVELRGGSGAVSLGSSDAAEEAYAVTAHWRPYARNDDPVTETVVGWNAARRKGRKLACLSGVIAVVVRDSDGEIVGHWDAYSNIWRDQDTTKAIRAQGWAKAADEIARIADEWAAKTIDLRAKPSYEAMAEVARIVGKRNGGTS